MLLEFYLKELGVDEIPPFLEKYLIDPKLLRLKKIGYFCGMDYASKYIYDFKEKITRYDHSLSVALLTYRLTHDKEMTLAALYHDISTPCFSHVIDYMNNDYENQSSTEEYTEYILRDDIYLAACLKDDGISIENIIDFKNYSIVDNDRPKLCADRLDGIILTAISWTRSIDKDAIKRIIDDLSVYMNEDGDYEIGLNSREVAEEVLKQSRLVNAFCHSDEDNYMMDLLANITKLLISLNIITYDDLYIYNEEEIFDRIKSVEEKIYKSEEENKLCRMYNSFRNIRPEQITSVKIGNVKDRVLEPIGNGRRVK